MQNRVVMKQNCLLQRKEKGKKMVNICFVRLRGQNESGPRYTVEKVRGWIKFQIIEGFLIFTFDSGDTVWYNVQHVIEFSTTEDE